MTYLFGSAQADRLIGMEIFGIWLLLVIGCFLLASGWPLVAYLLAHLADGLRRLSTWSVALAVAPLASIRAGEAKAIIDELHRQKKRGGNENIFTRRW